VEWQHQLHCIAMQATVNAFRSQHCSAGIGVEKINLVATWHCCSFVQGASEKRIKQQSTCVYGSESSTTGSGILQANKKQWHCGVDLQ